MITNEKIDEPIRRNNEFNNNTNPKLVFSSNKGLFSFSFNNNNKKLITCGEDGYLFLKDFDRDNEYYRKIAKNTIISCLWMDKNLIWCLTIKNELIAFCFRSAKITFFMNFNSIIPCIKIP